MPKERRSQITEQREEFQRVLTAERSSFKAVNLALTNLKQFIAGCPQGKPSLLELIDFLGNPALTALASKDDDSDRVIQRKNQVKDYLWRLFKDFDFELDKSENFKKLDALFLLEEERKKTGIAEMKEKALRDLIANWQQVGFGYSRKADSDDLRILERELAYLVSVEMTVPAQGEAEEFTYKNLALALLQNAVSLEYGMSKAVKVDDMDKPPRLEDWPKEISLEDFDDDDGEEIRKKIFIIAKMAPEYLQTLFYELQHNISLADQNAYSKELQVLKDLVEYTITKYQSWTEFLRHADPHAAEDDYRFKSFEEFLNDSTCDDPGAPALMGASEAPAGAASASDDDTAHGFGAASAADENPDVAVPAGPSAGPQFGSASVHSSHAGSHPVEPLAPSPTQIAHEIQELILKEKKERIFAAIDHYLDRNPGSYKKAFFKELKVQLEGHFNSADDFINALSAALKNDLSDTTGRFNLALLFDKRGGRKNSRAAQCIRQIYQLATGLALSVDEFSQFVKTGLLPICLRKDPDVLSVAYSEAPATPAASAASVPLTAAERVAADLKKRQHDAIISVIKNYLAKNPKSAKRHFFEDILKKIETVAETAPGNPGTNPETYLAILQGRLKTSFDPKENANLKSKPDALFKNIRGRKKSKAAECLRDLYYLATGVALSDRQFTAMVEKGELPDAPQEKAELKTPDQEYDEVVENIRAHPARLGQSLELKEKVLQLNIVGDMVDQFAGKPEIIGLLHKQEALKIIDDYLAQDPNDYKTDFFNALRAKFSDLDGFTLARLAREFSASDSQVQVCKKLFEKYSGPQNSRAAKCIADLYTLASGEALTEPQLIALTNGNGLPTCLPGQSQDFFKEKAPDKIRKIIDDPVAAPKTEFTRAVLTSYLARMQSLQTAVDEENRQKEAEKAQKSFEAAYQNALLVAFHVKFTELSASDKPLRFGPQGHLFMEVSLSEDQIEVLRGRHDEAIQSSGIKLEQRVLCNVDVLALPDQPNQSFGPYRAAFIKWMQGRMVANLGLDEPETLFSLFFNSSERSSLPALQEEMELHMRLSLRVLQTQFPDIFTKELFDTLSEQAAAEINELVLEIFSKALLASYISTPTPEKIDYKKLSNALSDQRKRLAEEAKRILAGLCMKNEDFYNAYKRAKDKKPLKLDQKIYDATAATDFAALNVSVGCAELILGVPPESSTKTSHDKKLGAHEGATRVVLHSDCVIEGEGAGAKFVIQAPDVCQLSIRTPSLAVIERPIEGDDPVRAVARVADKLHMHFLVAQSVAEDDSVRDVAAKLGGLYAQVQSQLRGFKGPMVYNLLTSISSDNDQKESAKRILKGAHIFNAEQVANGQGYSESLCYVQNIGINESTLASSLDHGSTDPVIAEATLMADMSMLATLSQKSYHFSPKIQAEIRFQYSLAHAAYVKFLNKPEQGTSYFYTSQEGEQVVAQLEGFKKYFTALNVETGPTQEATVDELITKALAKLFASNDYEKPELGRLVQSLSVFIEKASLVGCKSAVDRYSAIAGRVNFLRTVSRLDVELLPDDDDLRRKLLKALWTFSEDPNASPKALSDALDHAYDVHGLYNTNTIASTDTGGPSKLLARNSIFKYVDTNRGESSLMTRFNQKGAGSMQAHKGQAKKMDEALRDAFEIRQQHELEPKTSAVSQAAPEADPAADLASIHNGIY